MGEISADTDRLLPEVALTTLEAYIAVGGGTALHAALQSAPKDIIGKVTDAGLRGRGGAGFSTGVKWRSVRDIAQETGGRTHVVVNGAEGEPGTYKDRLLLQTNPFQVLEGALIARHAIEADDVSIGVKAGTKAAAILHAAVDQVIAAGWIDGDTIRIVEGPDEYLFGEETGLLEVIEGNLPLPRWLPPFQHGLFASIHQPRPTAVNNVETLANVPLIIRDGAAAFRQFGTDSSPGTMLFTVVGDVANPGVYELPLGTPLRHLLVDIAGARDVKAVFPGVSSPVIVDAQFDTLLTFDDMHAAGSSLGAGGFIVYDQRHCIVRVTAQLSHFLAIESCGQCTACKLGCAAITELLQSIERGEATTHDLQAIRDRIPTITDQTRCSLPNGEQLMVGSVLDHFADEFADHVGHTCDAPVVEIPKLVALDDATGVVTYDADYHRKQPDWSYTPEDSS